MVLCCLLACWDPEALTETLGGSPLAWSWACQNSDSESDARRSVVSLLPRYRNTEKEVVKEMQGTIVGLDSLCRPNVWAYREKAKFIQNG